MECKRGVGHRRETNGLLGDFRIAATEVSFRDLRSLKGTTLTSDAGVPNGGHGANRSVTMEAGVADNIVVEGGSVSDIVVRAESELDKVWSRGVMVTHFIPLVAHIVSTVPWSISN